MGKLLVGGIFNILPPKAALSYMDKLITEDDRLELMDQGFEIEVINDPNNFFLVFMDESTGKRTMELARRPEPHILKCYDYSDKPMD